jgi:crotonobetaine/carnitine-CoA ligase
MNDPRYESLGSLVTRQAERYGDRPFLTFDDGGVLTYTTLADEVARVRGYLKDIDVGAGERVALVMKNSLFYPVAWLGVASFGAVAVPVNSRLQVDDTRFVLEHSGAVAAFVDSSTEATVRGADVSALRHVAPGVSDATPSHDAPDVQSGALANIQYTSGTTGFPKGCRLTHRFWQVMGATAISTMEITEDDVLLTSQPHSYIDPQWNVIATLRAGAHLVLLDGFHPSTFMRDVASFGATVFYCLGVMPTLLLKQPAGASDREHALTRVFCSAIPPERHREIEERWGVPWSEAFGMTETGINTTVIANDHDRCVGSGSIGRPVPHNEATVFDENDVEVPPGEVGELVVRGIGMMEGYHRDPEATASFFRNGWAHTGDLATRDAEGFVYLKGRRKEMIRRGGENIAPVEVEAALTAHPDVIECAVAGVADPDMGEELKAYVVLREGAGTTPVELADHMTARIARFKVPRYWEFRRTLPRTPSERIAKHELERGADRAATTDLGPKRVPAGQRTDN